jgi:hypothetical protein
MTAKEQRALWRASLAIRAAVVVAGGTPREPTAKPERVIGHVGPVCAVCGDTGRLADDIACGCAS